MHLGTIPFTEAMHRCIALLTHLLLTERTALVKEACEEIHQHVRDLPIRARHDAYTAPPFMPCRLRPSTWIPRSGEQERCQIQATT
jgi:hypothetical protein